MAALTETGARSHVGSLASNKVEQDLVRPRHPHPPHSVLASYFDRPIEDRGQSQLAVSPVF